MKVSIITSTYNKNDLLPNVFKSIIVQNPPFDIEVCIVDDCSDISPEPIIKKFFSDLNKKNITYKFLRLEKKSPDFQKAKGLSLQMSSDESEIVILQSCDVIHGPNAITELVKYVGKKEISFAPVSSLLVDKQLYKNFSVGMKTILKRFNKVKGKHKYTGASIPGAWLMFLGAARKEDLIKLGYVERNCDAIISPLMKQKGFKANLLTNLKGIHQHHFKYKHKCLYVNNCKFYCSRTKLKGVKRGKFFKYPANIIRKK